ncbi:hypothetical protein V496_05898 [Pseudogymnoascus sp. VKM F-4515 (FW-2607)]|nr:hypothetical protein V496_05898 [Pseudogymnoascus sp. VKM F-4515 (FW-2607)]KFY96102.1 hypothetical protein V498_02895 [Pseudogymnoascus sp. VKM F-4517 (FW-2822)]
MKVEAEGPLSSAFKTTQWDPQAILGIINPDRGSFTCMGYAPSKGRRCRNPIRRDNRDFVYVLIYLLTLVGPKRHEFATLLEEAADRSLCWRHENQVDDIAEKWKASIDALSPPTPKAKGDAKQSKSRSKKSQSTGSSNTRYIDESIKTEVEDSKQKEREQKEREKKKREQKEREQKLKEEEQRNQKLQQERRDKEARERRQQEARKRREREQQERREQAMKERREWQQSWQNYVTKWSAFKEARQEPSTVQQAQALIPWPTKSGRFGDLTEGNVISFYCEACPEAKTAAMFITMQRENLKWHPDKMVNLYRNCAPSGADKLAIEMICRVVLDLREKARAMRDK